MSHLQDVLVQDLRRELGEALTAKRRAEERELLANIKLAAQDFLRTKEALDWAAHETGHGRACLLRLIWGDGSCTGCPQSEIVELEG